MKEKTTLKQRLKKYEQGNCSVKEEEMLHNYFDSFQHGDDIWNEIGIDKKKTIHNQILHNVNQRIDQGLQEHKSKRNLFLKVAASIVLIIGFGLALNSIKTNEPIEKVIITKTTSNGQKITLKLPNGSQVRLNSGSTISYPEIFYDTREVTLVGEAFFEVTKNPNKKFIVSTADITTTVLGTSFNVSAYPNEELAVTVETGRVGVSSKDQQLDIDPGQQVTYEVSSKTLTMSDVDINNYTSWRNGVLQFNGSTLLEIADELERWYGVDIEFSNQQEDNCDLKLAFDNQSLEQVLKQVEAATGVEIHLNNDLVKIIGVGCKN